MSHFLKVDKSVLRITLQLLIPFKDGFIVIFLCVEVVDFSVREIFSSYW